MLCSMLKCLKQCTPITQNITTQNANYSNTQIYSKTLAGPRENFPTNHLYTNSKRHTHICNKSLKMMMQAKQQGLQPPYSIQVHTEQAAYRLAQLVSNSWLL